MKLPSAQDLQPLFKDTRRYVGRMNRKQYEKYFTIFTNKYGGFFELAVDYVDQADNKKKASHEVGERIVEAAKLFFAKRTDGEFRENVQKHLNTFMVMYVFPCILRTNEKYADLTARGVLEIWNRRKSNGPNIKYADYDSICKGFKR